MTLFSHLSVQSYNELLSTAMQDDALSLLHNKTSLIDIENLITHSPRKFLRQRPLIVVYSFTKPLGLFENFTGVGGKDLSLTQCYSLAKVIELQYRLIHPTIMLPLSVSEIHLTYDVTRSKSIVNMLGSVSPGGQYCTISNRLMQLGSKPVLVPPGLVLTQHDNNQILGYTHETKVYSKQKLTLINANAHIQFDEDDWYQYTPESYPGYSMYRDLSENEIKVCVPDVIKSYKPIYRAARAGSANFAIHFLKSEASHEPLVDNLNSMASEMAGLRVCNKCSIVTSRTDISRCVDCSGSLVTFTNESVFSRFLTKVAAEGTQTKVRYSPFAGYSLIPTEIEPKSKLIPGDPDMIPPTSKKNVAELLNTSAHR